MSSPVPASVRPTAKSPSLESAGPFLLLLLLCFSIVGISCSSQAAEKPAQTPKTPVTKRSSKSPATKPQAPASATQTSKSQPAPKDKEEDEGPLACPEDMVLVEGDYCTDSSNNAKPDAQGNTPGAGAKDQNAVEHECTREWYAPQNNKRVCEEFAEKSTCKGKLVKKRFCIDPYTWPNKKGAMPEVMNRFHQAQVKCAAIGRRLCTESEWTMSCEGPEMKPFPYGYERDAKKCHGDEEWDGPNMTKVAQRDPKELRRLYKGKANGETGCVSDYGVHDLPGNTDEIVASETFESGWRGKYDSIHTGGPWYKGVRNQCRPKIYTHDEGFYYYFLGFRCCAEADGAETEPLTPKQKKEGWTMKRVENTAGITVKEMQEILEKKKTDPTCGCKTTRCRTFCGTLLGDDWPEPKDQATPDKKEAQPKKKEK